MPSKRVDAIENKEKPPNSITYDKEETWQPEEEPWEYFFDQDPELVKNKKNFILLLRQHNLFTNDFRSAYIGKSWNNILLKMPRVLLFDKDKKPNWESKPDKFIAYENYAIDYLENKGNDLKKPSFAFKKFKRKPKSKAKTVEKVQRAAEGDAEADWILHNKTRN